MSSRPKFTSSLVSALSTGRAPRRYDRAGRIQLIGEAAQALLAGRLPERDAALFLAGALLSWLETGGSLEREFLKVVKPKSHHTPAAIWQEIQAHPDERQAEGSADTLAPSSDPESDK